MSWPPFPLSKKPSWTNSGRSATQCCRRYMPWAKAPRPLPFAEDIGVHPADLPVFVERAQAILKRVDVTASFLIHAATGQVHLRPILDPDQPADAAKLWPLAEDLHTLALGLGGTVSAQHGTGLARTPWVERQYKPLVPVFRALKGIFDPHGILNPGKIVGPDPSHPAWPLRGTTVGGTEPPVTRPPARVDSAPLLIWQPDEIARAVAACNGCGACRTESPARRMCPTFHATHSEAAAPRAKANLFRSLLESGTRVLARRTSVRSPTCASTARCAHPSAPGGRTSRSSCSKRRRRITRPSGFGVPPGSWHALMALHPGQVSSL